MNFQLVQYLRELAQIELVSWGGSQKWLPLILLYFFIKSFWILLRRNIDIIHLGDALLAPLGFMLGQIFRKPVTVTVHAKDIVWNFKLYQLLIPRFLSRLQKVICVSKHTRKECIIRGVKPRKAVVIPNGVDPSEFPMNEDKQTIRRLLSARLNIDIGEKKLLLSVGRLVHRKGFHWFISNVMPNLVEIRRDILYLIAGEGPLHKEIQGVIKRRGLEEYVVLLGMVDNKTLKLLYNASDVLIMPNIRVEGDTEGFVIVALEASSCGLPVIASRLEGIEDAVKDGVNGLLVEPYDAEGFVKAVIKTLERNGFDSEYIRLFVTENFSWDLVSARYLAEFKDCVRKKRHFH